MAAAMVKKNIFIERMTTVIQFSSISEVVNFVPTPSEASKAPNTRSLRSHEVKL